jgi:hypothetical protein
MTAERGVRILAGTFVLLSLGLAVPGSPIFVDVRWLWLTAFVGVNLFQSGFTGFCPAEIVLRKAGLACPRPPPSGFHQHRDDVRPLRNDGDAPVSAGADALLDRPFE